MNFPLLIKQSRTKLKEISLEINNMKDKGIWNEDSRRELASKYISMLESLEPIIPETVKLVKEDVKYE